MIEFRLQRQLDKFVALPKPAPFFGVDFVFNYKLSTDATPVPHKVLDADHCPTLVNRMHYTHSAAHALGDEVVDRHFKMNWFIAIQLQSTGFIADLDHVT